MFKIGEFSKLGKTSIKTLRFYDEIGLFKPTYVEENGYRYYSNQDLNKLAKIIELRSLGLSINEIKKVLRNGDLKSILTKRETEIKKEINQNKHNLALIKELLKNLEKDGDYMKKYQVEEITIPKTIVYYRHGVIKSMSNIVEFILEAGDECRKNNPDLKCTNYCFVTYEAPEYQENNVELEYVEAVEKIGNESKNIKFKILPEIKAVSVKHKGALTKLSEAYAFAINYVREKGYEISDKIREVYIHGCWDCENENDYLTEIQIPIK